MFQAPRGTVDILPADQLYWRYIEQKAAHICQLYGYQRIDTPVFEDTALFARGVGEGTDIVEKEMYTFADRGGNKLTLRPEGTAPVCRAYLEHGMQNLPQPVRLYYFSSAFRYERPQAGRYRQHHQFGCEAIGDGDPALDAEVIDMSWHFFLSLGLKKLFLLINSIGCRECRPQYIDILRSYYLQHGHELCDDCKMRLEKNPLRLLDCKQSSCQVVADAAPRSIDSLCPACHQHFESLKTYLNALELPFEINSRLVRGLDYYTRTVFEIQPEEEGAQSTIGGGGRYDNLIEALGGKPTPGVGFATGFERIVRNLKSGSIPVPPVSAPKVFLAFVGDEARAAVVKLAAELRQAEIGAIAAAGSRSLKAQLRQADALGARFTLILGEQEIKEKTVVLRDMTSAQQETLTLAQLANILRERVQSAGGL